jgi:hypothetical protein
LLRETSFAFSILIQAALQLTADMIKKTGEWKLVLAELFKYLPNGTIKILVRRSRT